MKRNPGETLFLIVVLAALAGSICVLAPPGLASNEEGVLWVQMKNFALNGSFEIHVPAVALGFESKDFAGLRSLLEARDGRLYAITPPLFPWVASLFYPLVGDRAVDFTPVLFTFLSALILGLTLDRVMQRDFLYWLLLAAFLLGSPVLMQGFQFSGMALALLVIVSALWLLMSHFGDNPSRVKLFLASVLVGASASVRPECLLVAASFYLCAPIVVLAQRRMKDLGAVLAGTAVSLAVLVLHDVVIHGRFPGPYLQLYIPFYELSPIRVVALGGLLALSFVLMILSQREGSYPVRKAILSILSVILVFSAVLLTAARITVSHLLALFPVALLVFYGMPERIEQMKTRARTLEAILAATVMVCLALGAMILHPREWIVLSAWLPIVPMVILLLALERTIIFATGGMHVVLAFFCGVAFINGIQESKDKILKYKDYNTARIAFLERHTSAGDAILFNDAGTMEHAGPLFFDRVFLVAKSPGDPERFARLLGEKGVDRLYAWTPNPLGIKGFNPYGAEIPPAFPPPPGAKSCCGKSCTNKNFYLVRLDTRAVLSTGAGRGGS